MENTRYDAVCSFVAGIYIYIYVYRLPVSKDDFNVKAIIQSTFGTQTVANGCNGYIKGGVAPANPGSQWVID